MIWKNKKHKTTKDDKAKSHNFLANTNQSQTQTQVSKKNKHDGSRQGRPVIRVNATKVSKKDMDKDEVGKDLSYIKYYTY